MPPTEPPSPAEPVTAAAPDGRWSLPPAGWSLLLPPGWWHVPLGAARDRSIRTLVDTALASLPRDSVASLRRELVATFELTAARAADAGAQDLYVFSDVMRGLPVGATCLATVLDTTLPGVPAETLARGLAQAPDDVPAVLVVDGVEVAAVRRSSPGNSGLPADTTDTDTLLAALPSTRLDVHVPWPGRPRTLLLSFVTTVPEPAQEAMATLFEAIAETLLWEVAEAGDQPPTAPRRQ